MISKIRGFIAQIIDTRVSEAVSDIHRSMQHLEFNNDERQTRVIAKLDKLHERIDSRVTEAERVLFQKLGGNDNAIHHAKLEIEGTIKANREQIISAIASNAPVVAKPPVPPAPGTKKPFIGSELKNERLKNSKEWAATSDAARQYFIAMVKDRFNDIELQGCFEQEFFKSYLPVIVMLSNMHAAAAKYAEDEVI